MKAHIYRNQNPSRLFLILGISLFVFVFLQTPPESNNSTAVLLFGAPFPKAIWVFPLLLIFLSLLYSLTQKYLSSPFLTWFHTFASLSTALTLVVLVFFGLRSPGQLVSDPEWIGNTIKVLSLVLFVAQLVFLVNILKGVYASWQTR